MPEDPRSRVDAVYNNNHRQNGGRQARVPEVTITAAPTSTEEPALRRPLNLGIATAAANSAARAAAASAQRPPVQQQYNSNASHQPPVQSRVQQKLQRNNGPSSPLNNQPMPMSGHPNNNARSMSPQHQQQQQHVQQQQPTSRQAGPNGIRPFELRGNVPPQYNPGPSPPGQHRQQQGPPGQNRRPDLPVLQVTVPPQVYHNQSSGPNRQSPPKHQQQRNSQSPAPFSSSAETLVGVNAYGEKDKLYYNGNNGGSKPPNWSPSSSASSSSHTHGHVVPSTPRSPFAAANSPYGHGYGHPPPSPSIKNLQLSVPSNVDMTADSENDRLSPAMPRLRNNGPPGSPGSARAGGQQDWWKRFSTVVRENEQREQMAEKIGGKGSKVQSEWLDAQAHRQRKHRIWVGVVAFIILAAIGGGLAYHYVTKDKDSDNAVTVPTTHGIEITKSDSSSAAAGTVAASSVIMAAPSAVPAGNNLGTRDGLDKRSEIEEAALALPVRLLAARSSVHTGAHARRHKHLHHLD